MHLKRLVPALAKGVLKNALHHVVGSDIVPWRTPEGDIQRIFAGRSPKLIVDGGAHHGHVSAVLADLFPTAQIHAFEPFSDSFAALARLSGSRPRIVAWHAALSSKNGHSTLFCHQSEQTNALSQPTEYSREQHRRQMEPVGTEYVRTLALDQWRDEHTMGGIDLLKLDVQGHELEVLRGAEQTLKSVTAVLSEVAFVPLYANGTLFHELAGFLAGRDFQLYQLYNLYDGGTSPDGQLISGDALFVRRA